MENYHKEMRINMDIYQLHEKLNLENIPSQSYSIFEKSKEESLCLQKEGDLWTVFYSEKNLQTNKKNFKSESDACYYFLKTITSWFK